MFRIDKETTSAPVFNMAVATLQRIDLLLQQLSAEQVRNRVQLTQRLLYELLKEIYPFMKEEERADAFKRWQAMRKYGVFLDQNTGKINFNPQLPGEMHNYDFYLRDLLHKHHLLMPKAEDPGTAIGRM